MKSEKWKVGEDEVDNGNSYNMKSDDDESANGNVCYHRKTDAIENLAAIKHSEEEGNICGIEYDDMQHVLT